MSGKKIQIIRHPSPDLPIDQRRFKIIRKGNLNTRVQLADGYLVLIPTELIGRDGLDFLFEESIEQLVTELLQEERDSSVDDYFPWLTTNIKKSDSSG